MTGWCVNGVIFMARMLVALLNRAVLRRRWKIAEPPVRSRLALRRPTAGQRHSSPVPMVDKQSVIHPTCSSPADGPAGRAQQAQRIAPQPASRCLEPIEPRAGSWWIKTALSTLRRRAAAQASDACAVGLSAAPGRSDALWLEVGREAQRGGAMPLEVVCEIACWASRSSAPTYGSDGLRRPSTRWRQARGFSPCHWLKARLKVLCCE
mgnify:CR=1 FL=1